MRPGDEDPSSVGDKSSDSLVAIDTSGEDDAEQDSR
jgi:hypothetical protein